MPRAKRNGINRPKRTINRQQVLLYKMKDFEKNWDKKYLSSAAEALRCIEGGIALKGLDELAMYLGVYPPIIGLYCLITLAKDNPKIEWIYKNGYYLIDMLTF